LKYFRQLAIILLAFFLGEMLSLILPLPIPGNVLGMVLLFIGLLNGIVKVHMIEDVGNFLLSHLSFFFVPAGVGLIVSYKLLRGYFFAVFTICIVSTIIVLLVTGFTVKVLRRERN
jgi:holin-like protein